MIIQSVNKEKMFSRKLKKNVLFYLCFCLLMFVYMTGVLGPSDQYEDTIETDPANQPTKTILYWTEWWNNPTWFFGSGMDVFSHCPISNCMITDNRSEINIHNFDAVIFHSWNLFTTDFKFPEERSSHQR